MRRIKKSMGESIKEALTFSGNNFLIGYHRTEKKHIPSILKDGFLISKNEAHMYGKGAYFTYDIQSQERTDMLWYGDTILKCKINPRNLIIFDYNISKQVFGKEYTLNDQLVKHYKIYRSIMDIPKVLADLSKDLEITFDDPLYSADRAYQVFVKRFIVNGFCTIKGIRGIIITGNHDGNVLITYNPKTAVPIEFAYSDIGNLIVKKWFPIKDIFGANERAKKADFIYDRFHGNVLDIEIINGDYDLEDFSKDFPWFMKAKYKNIFLTIDASKKSLSMHGDDKTWLFSTWLNGEWRGDEIRYISWHKGVHYSGTFKDSNWHYGNFKGGVFESGNWDDGIWTDGEWKNTLAALWMKGEIKVGKRLVQSTVNPVIFFDQQKVSENSLKNLFDESFYFDDLTQDDQDELYDKFRQSYIKAVGTSWDRDRFESRAGAWEFFGSKEGGIAVRKQRSGMYKLVATFGSPREIMNAFNEMTNEIGNKPIWGVMTLNLAMMLEKRSNGEFKQPPKLFVKTLIPKIKNIFGDVIHSVEKDGGIMVDTPAGLMKKFFIANNAYYKEMLDQMENRSDSLPIPKPVVKILLGILKKFI